MTCSAIGKLGKFFRVIRRSGFMTVQAPTHIYYLWILSYFNLGHIPMTVLAVQTSRNMWPMREMDKIRHLRYRYPFNWLVALNIFNQYGQLFAGKSFGDLLMTSPTFCLSRQAR